MGGGSNIPDYHLHQGLRRREATEDDLDAITEIVQNGFPDDPGCNYKYPYRDRNQTDFLIWTKQEYKGYINQPEKYRVLVVTAPHCIEDAVVQKPIAVGVWDMAVEIKSKVSDHGINERQDADREHVRVYRETMSCAFSMYFLKYGNNQLNLLWLITVPKFRRHGAGTSMCNWGQNEAEKRGCAVLTVMASPMGKRLYENLGYSLLGSVTAQKEGEVKNVEVFIMEKKVRQVGSDVYVI
ncbi:acyl-CoA N-acyltransferase [Biscogniauxia sp. FL1348]|nr:acyl-CoA N-acyltransferase [Biscogniauxia sp. FL1348]